LNAIWTEFEPRAPIGQFPS